MVNEDTVAYIVDTYELPAKMSERLTRIAVQRLKQHDIENFDYQYGYIAALVDKYTRRRERRTRSLDAPLKSNDKRTLYCLIGRRDEPQEEHTDDKTDWYEAMRQSLALVRPRLSRPQRVFLQQLADRSNGCLRVNPYRAASDVESIRERMDELSAKYQRNGHIALPCRPIKDVRFLPLHIWFAHRRLKGKALSFFRENKETYGNMTRSELARFDPGLYLALHSEGTIGQAIP